MCIEGPEKGVLLGRRSHESRRVSRGLAPHSPSFQRTSLRREPEIHGDDPQYASARATNLVIHPNQQDGDYEFRLKGAEVIFDPAQE
ncbi:hypothetical protein [Bradyrhizobium sp. B117]|uniref:hypothetical protein n=1 Tax=Bradyrhizobium sp. B117 TaxID=3140246 RepID=UPI00318447C7